MRKLTKFITKLFKNSSLKISFKTENTKSLNINKNKFNKCDIYHSICPECNMKYIGWTGTPFHAHDKLKCAYLN